MPPTLPGWCEQAVHGHITPHGHLHPLLDLLICPAGVNRLLTVTSLLTDAYILSWAPLLSGRPLSDGMGQVLESSKR